MLVGIAISDIKAQSDTVLISKHLHTLVSTESPRRFDKLTQLNQTADYIFNVFNDYSEDVSFQSYQVGEREYKNVIASFGPLEAPRIIIGAHYDVCGTQPGADDNASGVTGLLELSRLLDQVKLDYRIDLVAYTLEEPPYFRTENMGSFRHAKKLYDEGVIVKGMIVLEMIGYFDEKKASQDYPFAPLKLFYGSRGDFITVVKKFGSGQFARSFNRKFKHKSIVAAKTFTGPKALPGIDFSDHLNYWKFNYSALMITDTAFYRNKNYHESTDTIDSLDLAKMALVIDAVFNTIISI